MTPLPASWLLHPARRARASRIAAVWLLAGFASPSVAAPSSTCADYLAEASQVSGLPETLIASVLHVESRGRSAAISSAGARGCMQIMPATWAYLTARYGLGSDIYDPRANMIGGALYLREMVDRYGVQGGLAAYNAGPGRYEAWRDGRRSLPRETVNYVAQIAPGPGAAAAPTRPVPTSPISPNWKHSSLFVAIAFGSPKPDVRPKNSAASAGNFQPVHLSIEPRVEGVAPVNQADTAPSAPARSILFANIARQ